MKKKMHSNAYHLSSKWILYGLVVLILWLAGIILAPWIANISNILSQYLYFIYKPVCHQLPNRSFMINGLPFAVCVRCVSFYGSGIFVFLFYLFTKKISFWPFSVYLLLISPAIIDFLLEKTGVYQEIEIIRFVTGLILGIAFFQILILSLSDFKFSGFVSAIENR
jgi:uncharacterized membrane protein